jgi:hypothetical protein
MLTNFCPLFSCNSNVKMLDIDMKMLALNMMPLALDMKMLAIDTPPLAYANIMGEF